jgi:hypothetical protein
MARRQTDHVWPIAPVRQREAPGGRVYGITLIYLYFVNSGSCGLRRDARRIYPKANAAGG